MPRNLPKGQAALTFIMVVGGLIAYWTYQEGIWGQGSPSSDSVAQSQQPSSAAQQEDQHLGESASEVESSGATPGSFGGGYKEAKWGMSASEVKSALKLPAELDLAKQYVPLAGDAKLGFWFFEDQLYSVEYSPDLNLIQNEKVDLLKETLVDKYGTGTPIAGLVDSMETPTEVLQWEDGETRIWFTLAVVLGRVRPLVPPVCGVAESERIRNV